MEKRSAKIALAILVISAVIWLGGINVRAMIGFDLLIPGTLDFKSNIHPYIERQVYGLLAQSSLIVYISYSVVWICGIWFLKTTRFRLKYHGWLMMSAVLFYVFTPVEVYTGVLDARMWLLDHVGSNDLVEYRKLFIHRLAALSGVPMIALLCYYTIIMLAIFQPLKKLRPEEVSIVTHDEIFFKQIEKDI
jgi:hypothetical protein